MLSSSVHCCSENWFIPYKNREMAQNTKNRVPIEPSNFNAWYLARLKAVDFQPLDRNQSLWLSAVILLSWLTYLSVGSLMKFVLLSFLAPVWPCYNTRHHKGTGFIGKRQLTLIRLFQLLLLGLYHVSNMVQMFGALPSFSIEKGDPGGCSGITWFWQGGKATSGITPVECIHKNWPSFKTETLK